mgnify:CR=1 FL=1
MNNHTHYIAGNWCAGEGHDIQSIDPAKKNTIWTAKSATQSQVDSAIEAARAGEITPEMEFVAKRENLSVELIRDEVAAGRMVIPANKVHVAGRCQAHNFLAHLGVILEKVGQTKTGL